MIFLHQNMRTEDQKRISIDF